MKIRTARKIIRYLYRKKSPRYRWHTMSAAMDVAWSEWVKASLAVGTYRQPWSVITPGRNV